MFKNETNNALKYYVYRLVDPRNNQTFYVGKGTKNRVFNHKKLNSEFFDKEILNQKQRTIQEIHKAGKEIIRIIHRHGLDKHVAFEVEAALIEAYPSLCNLVCGHHTRKRGCKDIAEIKKIYESPQLKPKHKLLLITINWSIKERKSIYESVRRSWVISPSKASKVDFVLAIENGLVIEIFKPSRWLPATIDNFPKLEKNYPDRFGFIGSKVKDPEIRKLYFEKRIPKDLRPKGAINPIRYVN